MYMRMCVYNINEEKQEKKSLKICSLNHIIIVMIVIIVWRFEKVEIALWRR